MPSVRLDIDVDLSEMCNIKKLKPVALISTDKKIKEAADTVNRDLDLFVKLGDENCPVPPCDLKYRKWLAERAAADAED
jgi:hypothetical protein